MEYNINTIAGKILSYIISTSKKVSFLNVLIKTDGNIHKYVDLMVFEVDIGPYMYT